MSKLKFGIVGCGVISKTHATAISALSSDAELVAVCDVIEDRARKLAQDFGVKRYILTMKRCFLILRLMLSLSAHPLVCMLTWQSWQQTQKNM